jgi:predicted flap endonuclease-1-like 5' DNA nuclease
LNQKVAALYEKGITNPSQIARLLDSSTCKIERKMNKLAKIGRINRKASSP